MADQEAFARLSGDRNPIHMDAVAARRTQAGAPVVHGVHGLLWALEQAARARPLAGLRTIAARFNRFVYLDTEVGVRLTEKGESLVVDLLDQDHAATTVKLDWGAPHTPALNGDLFPARSTPLGQTPDDLAFEAMAGLTGRIDPSTDDIAGDLFPALCGAIGAPAVRAIAAASGVVGMSCPGLHSLFSQLTLRRIPPAPGAPGLGWRTARIEARARWVVLDVAGAGWEGEIICMARPEPAPTPSMADLAGMVEPGEFAERSALVIGGSRGLGAVTAKLLAAGGGRVVLTYARGRQDAEDLAREIRQARGANACAILPFDVAGDVVAQLQGLPGPLSHLYYFATPRIGSQKGTGYDRAVLDQFLDVYVDGFRRVWDALALHRPLSALYPSTVFIDQQPKGMTEYVMAKAAGEMLCADLRRSRDVSILAPRIPRTLTDQTATSPPTPAADAVEIMLPLLRAQA